MKSFAYISIVNATKTKNKYFIVFFCLEVKICNFLVCFHILKNS